MSPLAKSVAIGLAIAFAGALLSGCASSAKRDTAIFLDGDRLHTGTGATISSGSGSGNASGANSAPAAPKEPRATPPVGTDRDGQGPASGAIVDPTGAASQKSR